jgi:hypothetical protein
MTWELYFKILIRLAVMVWLGVFGGRLLEESGNAAFIHRITRPLTRFANLPPFCGTAMTSSFFAGFSGDALLGSYYKESRLSQRQAVLASMMLNLPFYVSFLPMLVGIVYPLLGNLGLIYLGIQVMVSGAVTLVAALVSHFILKDGNSEAVVDTQFPPSVPISVAAHSASREAFKMTFRILLIAGPILAAVVLLVEHNVFSWLQSIIPSWIRVPGISPVALPGVVAQGFHISSGAAVTGSMLHLRLITPKEGLLVMLAGNLLGTPFRSLRILLPTYMGAYGGKTGVKVLFSVQGVRTVFVLLAYILVLLW